MFDTNIFDYVKPNKIGDFELIDKVAKVSSFRDNVYAGQRITILKQNGEVVMSNTDMEKRTNTSFVQNAHGDVLIGGLGIGMIVLEIQNKENVNSITIIEKNEEVIELLQDLPYSSKVNIVHDDVFAWKSNGKKFDVIYIDIWNYVNSEVYEEMKQLKTRYRRCLVSKKENPNRKISCWAEYEAKNNLRLM